MYSQIDIFSDLIALQLGIVHPTVANAEKEERPRSIDEALSSMTEEEARRCRRKFRKLLRLRSKPADRARWSPRRRRSEVMMNIRNLAWDLFGSGSEQAVDNDE